MLCYGLRLVASKGDYSQSS